MAPAARFGVLCVAVISFAGAGTQAQPSGEQMFNSRMEEPTRSLDRRPPDDGSAGLAANTRSITDWRTGYELLAPDYDAFIAQCMADGFRPVSVVSRDATDGTRFTVVAHQDGLTDWVHARSLNAADMTAWADARLAEDYEPVCVAAEGTVPNDLYTAVMVHSGDPRAFSVHVGLTGTQYGSLFNSSYSTGGVVSWFAGTGNSTGQRFAAVVTDNWGAVDVWTWWGNSLSQFQTKLDQGREQGWRPTSLSWYGSSAQPRFAAVLHDWRTERWEVRDGLSIAEMQQQEADLRAGGYYATTLTVYETVGGVLCAGVFVRHPEPRVLTVAGEEVPELAAFDQAMEDHIMACDMPNAALAVVKDGRLVLARGYTYAGASWPTVTEPDTLFRIASMSKPMCSIAMHQAAERGALGLDDFMVDYPNLDGWVSQAAQDVTLRYLLQHRGGWNRGNSFDPVFNHDVAIATYFGIDLPITVWDIINYMKHKSFQFAPGTQQQYSNLGFLISARVLESVDGRPFEQIVRQDVLGPLDIYRSRMAEWTGDRPGESRYLDGWGASPPSVMSPEQEILEGYCYGGYNFDNTDASAQWIYSAIDYARLLRAFDDLDNCALLPRARIEEMWAPGLGDPQDGERFLASGWIGFRHAGGDVMGHGGSLPGAATVGYRLETGEIFVVFQNTLATSKLRNPYDIRPTIEALIRAQEDWPSHDLFPMYCASDFNRDRVRDTRDFLAFLNAYTAGDDRCDFSGDGVVNTVDVLRYLNLYVNGCN